jgi:putative endonuclease
VYHVYILRCADDSLYVGLTNDVVAREQAHNEGRASRYTAKRLPVTVVYSEECASLQEAVKREHQVKRWTRAKKAALIAGDLARLRRL